jgi:hypothetical protein
MLWFRCSPTLTMAGSRVMKCSRQFPQLIGVWCLVDLELVCLLIGRPQ